MAKNINKYMKLNKISRKMSETLLVEDKQTALTSLRGGLTMNAIFVYLQNKRLDVRLSTILND